jgi:hypothetical protein
MSRVCKIEAYCYEEIPYDETIAAIFRFIVSTEPMIGEGECAPAVVARDLVASENYVAGEEEYQEVPGRQTFDEYLTTFAACPTTEGWFRILIKLCLRTLKDRS